MSNLARKPPLGLKPAPMTAARIREGKIHMARVARLPCVICHRRPVHVHHCIHGRYSQRRASDFEVIPLCPECHLFGPLSIHQDKAAWRDRNGADHEYLPVVADMLAGEWTPFRERNA